MNAQYYVAELYQTREYQAIKSPQTQSHYTNNIGLFIPYQ